MHAENPFLNLFRAGYATALFSVLAIDSAAQTFIMADGAVWESCSGTFYDSGGDAGNYGASESVTATLCPSGGAGAGPFTSITFTAWGIGVGDLVDALVIHDGATTAGAVLATGSGPNSLLGQTFTATDPSGCLTFAWTSDLLLNGSGWAAVINTAPDAGGDGAITICSTAPQFDLFDLLSGTPDPGGEWTFSGALVSNTYTPGSSSPGVYTYTVPAVAPCVDATATVTVTEVAAADAGFDNSITVCSDDPPFSMLAQLLGTPDGGGVWTDLQGVQNDQFDPATEAGGVFTYDVTGDPPCANATSELTVTVVQAPDAGADGDTTICSSAGAFDLFALLGGAPDPGGTWTAPNNSSHGSQFQPGTDAAGNYTYTVTGQAPCANDLAIVTVSVQNAIHPGTSTSTTRCSNSSSFNMKTLLGTTATGSWSGPSTVTSNTYNPVTMLPGTYTFTVAATGVCPAASATVDVTEVQAPDAGLDGSKNVCSNGSNFDLFNRLGGTPDAGGSWTDPVAQPFPTGVFIPGTSQPGIYTYTVTGTAPCANDVSIVTVNEFTAPNAGTNGSTTFCSNGAPDSLRHHLGNDPDYGGVWHRPVPPGGTMSGVYNPANGGHPAGTYTYIVTPSTGPCRADSATVTVVEYLAPNAGIDGTLTLCSTSASVNLINSLGGSPNGSGTWFTPSNILFPTGLFNPAVHAEGIYKYVVAGTAPCANDTGRVTVVVHPVPDAGISDDTTVCSNGPDFDLIEVLDGTPDVGGFWTPGNGSYEVGEGQEGSYIYTVTGLAPCINAQAVVTVVENDPPDAGSNGSESVCSTEPPFNLFNELGGNPDPGGTWSPGDPAGIYTPGTSTPGLYTYTVAGVAPCSNDLATVNVIENPAPDPGDDGNTTVCEGTEEVELFPLLGGSPDGGGSWQPIGSIAPGTLSGGVFFCENNPPGDYEFHYNLPGNGSCPPAHADVHVIITSNLNAGSNGNCTACDRTASYNLFNCLGSNPQPGGTWKVFPNGPVEDDQFVSPTALGAGVFQYQYTLAGSGGCPADSAVATLTISHGLAAGPDVSVTLCSNASSTALFPYLIGAESPGIWRRTSPPGPYSGTYNPITDNPAVFLYITQNSSPCANDTARVTVSEVTAPNAGGSAGITRCLLSNAFNMTDELNGTPALNGVWRDPSNNVHSSTFVPGVDPEGVWTYTVNGITPCSPAISSLTIDIVNEADAGLDGDVSICSNTAAFALLTVLNGSPDANGVWTDTSGAVIANGLYTPGTLAPGDHVFMHVVSGAAPCPNDTAYATVFENQLPDAGISTNRTICLNETAVDLFTVLGGTPDPTGTWNNGFSGIYFPDINAPGIYTYTVAGTPPCSSANASVTVTEATPPFAGNNTSIQTCSSQDAITLVTQLNGPPSDVDGDWYMGGVFQPGGFFDPGVNPAGVYEFLYVLSEGDCPADSSLLVITNYEEVDAGCDGATSACSSGGDIPLFPFLNCGPDPGGTWRRPNGSIHDGIFDPGSDQNGNYTYRKAANGACPADSAKVTVTLYQEPFAGGPGIAQVCSDQETTQLINYLTGVPNTPGTWVGPNGAHSGFYVPEFDDPGVYIYTVAGTAPCPNASAEVTVFENLAPFAGPGGIWSVCGDVQGTFPLIEVLQGAQPGGQWFDSDGLPVPGVFTPSTMAAGVHVFKYLLVGAAPCSSDSAYASIIIGDPADAGLSTAPQLCSTTNSVSLTSLLGGDPDGSGTWFGPDLLEHGDAFEPANDPQGIYTYVVTGIAPCGNDTATVTINLISAPNAGDNGAISACVNDDNVDLFLGLGGNPQPNGTWSGPGQVDGIFDATAVSPGGYQFTYSVSGGGACALDEAVVTVNVTDALDAGIDSSADVCSGVTLCLFDLIGGDPLPGGVWRDLDLTGALDGCELSAATAGVGVHLFRYVLEGSANCPGDSALVTITVVDGPNAGNDGVTPMCDNANDVDLIDLLGGQPDGGGSWFAPGLVPTDPEFDPSSEPGGLYTYIVYGDAGCANDSATVNIILSIHPDAGSFGTLDVCSDGSCTPLFDALDGTPDAGGNWTYLGNGHGADYCPAFDNEGGYVYHVDGSGACSDATATVLVNEDLAPNAGCDNTVDRCTSQGSAPLSSFNGCAAQSGTWLGPGNVPHGPTFDPAVDGSGVYTYIVTGTGACTPDSVFITINLTTQPDAGIDSLLNVCNTEVAVDLFPALGPGADPGGSWSDDSGAGAAFINGVLDATGVAIGFYEFTYQVPGSGPCPGDGATVIVEVDAGRDPGIGLTDTICGGDAAYNMFGSLGGSPDHSGVWSYGPFPGILVDSLLDATQLLAGGPYEIGYTVTDPACGEASTTVTLYIAPFADPGADSSVTVCSTAAAFNLIDMLAGTPATGGTWTDLGGSPVDPVFDPATGNSATFRYNLDGTAPCNDTSALVVVIVNDPPQAGADGSLARCNNGSLDLTEGLNGAQSGGQWTDVDNTGQLNGSVVTLDDLAPGDYAFGYTVDVAGCGSDAATIILTALEGVRVVDTVLTCNEQDRTYTVELLIQGGDPASYSVTGLDGAITTQAPYVFTSLPLITSASFSVVVNDVNDCTPRVVEGISPCDFEDEVFIPESFTPNGDGSNDLFLIPGIEGYPDNTIAIFNRWGGEVYSAAGYDNKTVVWDGTSENALIPGDLPTGTYYFVLELNESIEPFKGFIYLNR